jgi:Ankyrin repeats (3 copies)/Ankyrin repeats (many copies)
VEIECSKALQQAAKNGHDVVVRLLLESGAKIGKESGESGNVLQVASAGGHEAVVRLLLEKGAEVNMESTHYGSPLQVASAGGHEAVVRLLLERGAEVNMGSTHYGSPLQVASAGGHEAVVRLLLEKGANLGAEDGKGASALDFAIAGDHQRVIRLLIDMGALDGPDRDDDVDSSSSLSASITTFSTAVTSSNPSLAASTVTPYKNELPEGIFTILTLEVLLNPELKDICEKMLRIKGEFRFMRIFKRAIREFCSDLHTESSTQLQKDSIWIFRRFSAYFAFRVCRLLSPSTAWNGRQLEGLMEQVPNVESSAEKYLLNLPAAARSRGPEAAERPTPRTEASSAGFEDSEGRLEFKEHEKSSSDIEVADDIEQNSLEFGDDRSSASDSSDDEPNTLPRSLTKETISWLVKSIHLRNLKHNISRHIHAPLEYVQEVLQSTLPSSELCLAIFNIEWDVIRYVKEELDDGQQLSTVLTVSGGVEDADASACVEYCRRTWPTTGEFVVQVLERALANGWHGK